MSPPPLLLVKGTPPPEPPLLLTPDHVIDGNQQEIALNELLASGRIKEEDVTHAQGLDTKSARPLLQTLNQIGVLSDADLAGAYSSVTGLTILPGSGLDEAEPELHGLNPDFLRERQALLLSPTGPLAAVNPLDVTLMRGIEYALGFKPGVVIIEAGSWKRAFARSFDTELDLTDIETGSDTMLAAELADQDRDAPIVRKVSSWISDAADAGASDIHLEAKRHALEVSYRIDGGLQLIGTEPKSAAASVIARIKVLSELDLGERNRSQDGRATIALRGRRLDIRVSIISTIDGESAVIRLLDRPASLLTLSSLGFSSDIVSGLEKVSEKQHGLFIVAGPTGSGKTTTLYACLQRLKGRGLKILSVEDPVEYHFDHVSQVQISEKSGRDFASVLRSFLRHDPNVIFVGEIRDGETARIAVQAALTGHLVLATVHAIDTSRVRTRLIDMDVEASQLDACLVGSMAQRLIRLLCASCKTPHMPGQDERALFEAAGIPAPHQIYDSVGCDTCRDEGFKGRTALAELRLTRTDMSERETLHSQGLKLVAEGRTTLAEILGLSA